MHGARRATVLCVLTLASIAAGQTTSSDVSVKTVEKILAWVDEGRVSYALLQLERIGPRLIPHILDYIASRDPNSLAFDLLTQFPIGSEKYLIPALSDSSEKKRRAAGLAINTLAYRIQNKPTSDTDAVARTEHEDALLHKWLFTQSTRSALVAAAKNSSDQEIRRLVLGACANLGYRETKSIAESWLRKSYVSDSPLPWIDINEALRVYAKLAEPADAEWICNYVRWCFGRHDEDGNWAFRSRSAVFAIGSIKNEAVFQALSRLVDDYEREIRSAACWMMREHQRPEALAILRPLARDKDFGVRISALGSIGCLAKDSAVSELMPYLRVEDEDTRRGAIYGLGHSKAKDAFEILVGLLKDGSMAIRNAAMTALGDYGDSRAMPYLEPFVTSTEREERSFAKEAIEKLKKLGS